MLTDKLTQIFSKYGIVAVYLFGSQVEGAIDFKSDIDIEVNR